MPHRLLPLLLAFTLSSWVLLLLSALSHAGGAAWVGGEWPGWTTLVAQGCFAIGVFLYARYSPDALRGQNFVGLLRRLAFGPGLLALGCVVLHLIERLVALRWPGNNPAFFTIIYTVNLGLFILFLARTNYAWRSLVLFKATPRLRREWDWFEILLGSTILFRLIGWNPPSPVSTVMLSGLAIFGVYLSGNQKWVAYLTQGQKWRAVGLQALLLLGMVIFVFYFLSTQHDPHLIAPEPQYAFLLLTAFFAAFYTLTGLLVTFFNLPTAGVFEQRRAEILSLQRLTQIIQRGQTATEIYQTLLDAAASTVQADAGWLDIADDAPIAEAGAPEGHYLNLQPAQGAALRQALTEAGVEASDYLNNHLAASPQLRALGLPYQSLVLLPLHGQQRRYATLYLLCKAPDGFDREDLGILQTFTTQTVLSLENLRLVQDSVENHRTQNELRIAAQVQDSLIPKKLPTDDWFEISSHALAAKEVGGDFYDLLLLPGKRLAILIGDVSGKGVTAAFHMAQMKGIFHSLMQPNPLAKSERTQYPVPSQFMTQANQALTHCLEKSSFITASLFLIDYEKGGFMFARAGHCHTLYYSSNQEKVEYFRSMGLGLGIIRGPGYEKHISNQFYDYAPGDVMVMYTDGIVEARGAGGEEYGEERLQLRLEENYWRSADDIKKAILADLDDFTRDQPVHDDQTLLVIRFKAAQPIPLG